MVAINDPYKFGGVNNLLAAPASYPFKINAIIPRHSQSRYNYRATKKESTKNR
jgi:hypothetical protein